MEDMHMHSVARIRDQIDVIRELAPLEKAQHSRARKEALEKAYNLLVMHCSRLAIGRHNLSRPYVGSDYSPDEYLLCANRVEAKLTEFLVDVAETEAKRQKVTHATAKMTLCAHIRAFLQHGNSLSIYYDDRRIHIQDIHMMSMGKEVEKGFDYMLHVYVPGMELLPFMMGLSLKSVYMEHIIDTIGDPYVDKLYRNAKKLVP